jgi:hypothetical protein
LTGCDLKSGNWAVSQKSKRQNFPTAVSKYCTWQFPSFFSEAPHFCLESLKVEEALENFKNPLLFFSYSCSFQPYFF